VAPHRAYPGHHRCRCRAYSKRRAKRFTTRLFNVGRNDENFRIRELADIVAEVVPGCRVEYAPGGGPDLRCYRVNFDKISRVLPAFRPQWTARKGAQELYDAYRTVGLTPDVLQGRYIRISEIRSLQEAGRLKIALDWTGPLSAETGRRLELREKRMTTTTQFFRKSMRRLASRPAAFAARACERRLSILGMSPLCETYPSAADLNRGETYYPLHTYVCEKCWLVQLEEYESAENIFSDYAYFSSYSDSWLKHCENYCGKMKDRFGLNEQSFVVEVASNDGYLLQYFVQRNVPVLGIEPAANVAKVAVEKGVPTLVRFFGAELARNWWKDVSADLVLGNNVLAQVPNLNDFVEGLKVMLKPEGVLTLEFPHLLQLIELNEFDTIYHEHFSYFSMLSTIKIMEAHGLRVFDVEELKSHGGSLRVLCLPAGSRRIGRAQRGEGACR
jgi:SAM-dependent methyltransferase